MLKKLFILSTFLFTHTICAAEEPQTLASAQSALENDPIQKIASLNSYFDRAQDLIMYAMGFLGINYKYGGNTPETGFDCSGFVRHIFSQTIGVTLPRNAKAMSDNGVNISKHDLKAGDLVFFNTLKREYSHVGIYLGDDRFIHSPSSGGGIEIANMSARYWANRYDGGRRILFD